MLTFKWYWVGLVTLCYRPIPPILGAQLVNALTASSGIERTRIPPCRVIPEIFKMLISVASTPGSIEILRRCNLLVLDVWGGQKYMYNCTSHMRISMCIGYILPDRCEGAWVCVNAAKQRPRTSHFSSYRGCVVTNITAGLLKPLTN